MVSPRPMRTTAPGNSWREIAASTSGGIAENPFADSRCGSGACAEQMTAASADSARRPFTRFNIYCFFQGVSSMRHGVHLFRGALAALCITAVAGSAFAQTGRVGGIVKDEAGQPIKGATVTAENPNTSPSSFTATTDDKGRFSIIGLRPGRWKFTVQAPGFGPESGEMQVQTIGAPNPPMTFNLRKGGGGAATGALGG